MAKWLYDLATKTFIDEDGVRMSEETLIQVRDDYLESMDTLLDDYATNLANGDWTLGTFEDEMRRRLKNAYVAEYTLGKGGAQQMTQGDYGRLGNMLRRQYGYLRGYLNDLQSGKETRGTAGERARNFLGSARQGFSRGRGRAYGLDLPGHPGDGGTPCHGKCRCHWDITEDDEEIRAYWIVSSSKPCSGCLSRSAEWGPFVQSK